MFAAAALNDGGGLRLKGFEAARYTVDEINRLGGTLGYRIELLEYDNESTPLGSVQAANM